MSYFHRNGTGFPIAVRLPTYFEPFNASKLQKRTIEDTLSQATQRALRQSFVNLYLFDCTVRDGEDCCSQDHFPDFQSECVNINLYHKTLLLPFFSTRTLPTLSYWLYFGLDRTLWIRCFEGTALSIVTCCLIENCFYIPSYNLIRTHRTSTTTPTACVLTWSSGFVCTVTLASGTGLSSPTCHDAQTRVE